MLLTAARREEIAWNDLQGEIDQASLKHVRAQGKHEAFRRAESIMNEDTDSGKVERNPHLRASSEIWVRESAIDVDMAVSHRNCLMRLKSKGRGTLFVFYLNIRDLYEAMVKANPHQSPDAFTEFDVRVQTDIELAPLLPYKSATIFANQSVELLFEPYHSGVLDYDVREFVEIYLHVEDSKDVAAVRAI